MSGYGRLLLVLLLMPPACGDDEDKADNEPSHPEQETDVTQPIQCCECCDCEVEENPPPPPPAMVRHVVTSDGEPLGYLAGVQGLLFTVLAPTGEHLFTINSATGALTGPDYWHHDGRDSGVGCSGPEFFPVSEGPCGTIEGMQPPHARVFSYFADPKGLFLEQPGSVMTARVTVGGFTTYKLGAQRSIVKHGWPHFCVVDEAASDLPAEELPDMCGLPLAYASALFWSQYATPIEIVATTEPLEADPNN